MACIRPKARGAPEAGRSRARRCPCASASISRERRRLWRGGAALRPAPRVFKNEEVRVWTLDGEVLSSPASPLLHLISPTVAEGLQTAR